MFKPCKTIKNRLVNQDGVVINSDGKTVAVKTSNKSKYVFLLEERTTMVTIDVLYKDAWYPDAETLLFKDGNRYNFGDNVIPLYKKDKGVLWGYCETAGLYVLPNGNCYGRTKKLLKGVNRTGRLRYAYSGHYILHIDVVLEAFGYLTTCNMFKCDLNKRLSLQEILDSYVGEPQWHNALILNRDEYVYELTKDKPKYKPVRVLGRTALYKDVKYSFNGYVVDENGLSVEVDIVGNIPVYNNMPVKVGVYKAFNPNAKVKHNRVLVKDGNELNTSLRNLKV